MLALTGCKTKYVSVPEYHKVYVARVDSFLRTDTIREKEWMTIKEVDSTELVRLGIQLKNMTSAYLIEKNKNIEHHSSENVRKADTIIINDSIRVPYPVEKPLSKAQQCYITLGKVFGLIISAGIAYLVFMLLRKR